ncbi:MAG: TrkH family potassium uptake protein [Desulfobacterales bacterium]
MSEWTLKKLSTLHSANLLFFSYLATIAVGTGLLMLPAATVSGSINPTDALFTATSAVCVTGLIVVDTGSYFTLFGQGVILVLIQLGGLGIMTISVTLFQLIGKKVFFQSRMAMQEVFSHTPRDDIYSLLRSIFVFTATVELAGATLLFFHWWRSYPAGKALYLSLFHSVSAFCNAGFSLFANSFIDERGSALINVTICTLIVLGGLGFPVVYELYRRTIEKERRARRFSVQFKTVLVTTGLLILLGMIVLLITEHNLLKKSSFGDRLLTTLFQSVTCRTAGFNTVDIGGLNSASLAFMMFLMYFGASPGSCGGGVKTTTLAVLAAFSWSRLKDRARVNMFQKSIPQETVAKSVSVVLLSIAIILVALFLILFSDPAHGSGALGHQQYLSILFETVSAFGTVGLSMGATATLNEIGKFIIVVVMIIGRVGVPTFAYIIAGPPPRKGLEYAEENVMIG